MITPTAGLRSVDTIVTREALRAFAGVNVARQRSPLPRSAGARAPRRSPPRSARLRCRAAGEHRVAEVRGVLLEVFGGGCCFLSTSLAAAT